MTQEEPQRKSSQEVEIDHLLAEEFICDFGFGDRFLAECKSAGKAFDLKKLIPFRTESAIPEPSLGGVGFGDLQVCGVSGNYSVVLLIEDKITAGAATRQAKRYQSHAERLRENGWQQVVCILVAPASYRGERDEYDASIDLEVVSTLLRSVDVDRLAYRRGIIARAIQKKASSGVRVPDQLLHGLKATYLEYMQDWSKRTGIPLTLPTIRESYYDGDSWVEHISHTAFPPHIELRYRMWTSVKTAYGLVDLIATRASDAERLAFAESGLEGATVSSFSKGKGVTLSLPVPEMRQTDGFDAETARQSAEAIRKLLEWYLAAPLRLI